MSVCGFRMQKLYMYVFALHTALLVTAVTAQVCPLLNDGSAGVCVLSCISDNDCSDGRLCCYNGCGFMCMSPVCATPLRCAAPNCSEHAAGTITPEGECCPVCACATTNGSLVPPGASFMNDCNTCFCGSTGVAACTLIGCGQTCPTAQSSNEETCVDECSADDDCQYDRICECGRHTCSDSIEMCRNVICDWPVCKGTKGGVQPVTSPFSCCPYCPITGQTCPTVQSSNEENCVDECSSDDDCQYDRICCSNGCGGHTCSDSVEMCQLIQCDWPVCEDGAQPVTSPFSCCPYCPTTGGLTDDNGGTGAIAITSLMAVTMCGLLAIFF